MKNIFKAIFNKNTDLFKQLVSLCILHQGDFVLAVREIFRNTFHRIGEKFP